ncbi:MAG TPA: DUF4145 domain-containing protein [Acidimicrobiales bacterium]|nr:DUF4145 domain-containing protein [Acidimicrobiales bacterium]
MDDRRTAGLPEGIARDLSEASTCCSVHAYRGAGLLTRRAVEQAVVMLGVPPTKRTLQQKIGWLLEEGHLPERWKPAARTISDVGNAAAHGASPISSDEAHAALAAALAVVNVLVGEGRAETDAR